MVKTYYHLTFDSNLDPFIVIDVTSDNGYGSIYRDSKIMR
jgi:hypothetical protein